MKKNRKNRRDLGFTLIEVLVVLTIISILAGLIYSTVSKSIGGSKKASAENTAYNVRNAIGSYFTDYRRYPRIGNDSSNGSFVDFVTDEKMMDVLLAADTEIGKRENPRGTCYFSGRSARRFDSTRWISGVLLDDDGSGELWDPFGRLYGGRIDLANRGRVPNPAVESPTTEGGEAYPAWGENPRGRKLPSMLTESVIVWSSGQDKDLAGDNPNTWGY